MTHREVNLEVGVRGVDSPTSRRRGYRGVVINTVDPLEERTGGHDKDPDCDSHCHTTTLVIPRVTTKAQTQSKSQRLLLWLGCVQIVPIQNVERWTREFR